MIKNKLILFFLLISQEILSQDTILITVGHSEINDEYQVKNIAQFTLIVPKNDIVANKTTSYNYCDSFKLMINVSGMPISLSDYDNLKLNSQRYKEFILDSCYWKKQYNGNCVKSITIYIELKLPIFVNGKELGDRDIKYKLLSNITK